jgi:hypothetical protein
MKSIKTDKRPSSALHLAVAAGVVALTALPGLKN